MKPCVDCDESLKSYGPGAWCDHPCGEYSAWAIDSARNREVAENHSGRDPAHYRDKTEYQRDHGGHYY